MPRCQVCRQELDAPQVAAGRCTRCGSAIAPAPRDDSSGPPSDDPPTRPDAPTKPNAPTRPNAPAEEPIELILATDDQPQDPAEIDDTHRTIGLASTETHVVEDPPQPAQPAGPPPRPKQPTVDDRVDATIEFDAPPDGDPADPKATVDPSTARATHPMRADFTIDFGGEDPDLGAHMSSEWGTVIASDSKQGQTLRQSGTINEFISKNTRSTLPVKNRSLRTKTVEARGEMTPLSAGDVPDYELLDMIGQGGMGVVYAATQSSIARTVAVKMFKPGANVTNEQRDKFISEAVVTGELDHPNIVPIYDMGANEEGALFYSMKRVKGTPWDDVILHKSLDENLNILMRVADAVAFAHAGGVVHRDLKPENVMLGDFGEVLVMDWGLARVTKTFRNVSAIYQADSLGGTPAYMAPEMARGPVESIDPRSDVYLLGAILYEVVTGRAPHSGRDVMQCLMAAANNKIDDPEQSGELVDIAMRAMATKPEDRYQTVKDLQADIVRYQSHSESLLLSDSARQHLESARQGGDYQLYARALYGFQEALSLWRDNEKARTLLDQTRLDYARAALANEDFDLGVSLLAGDTPEQQQLLAELERGKRDREARQRRLTFFKRLAAAAVAAFLIGGTYFTYEIRKQRNVAVEQRGIADKNAEKAEVARRAAEKAKEEEVLARKNEEEQRQKADESAEVARREKKEADEQRQKAEEQEQLARTAKEAEEYEAYIARIGLAAAKIDENAFDSARQILAECPPERRNWEWGRLSYLCGLSPRAFEHAAPVDAVAYSPDGRWIASGDWDGLLVLRDAATGQEKLSQKLAQYVHSVAFSRDGQRLAAGGSDGVVHVFDVSSGAEERALRGHQQGVLSVAFSPDGRRLVTAGYDGLARVWDVATGDELQQLAGHVWWVWSAEFSPDGERIVTASQDGKCIVWGRDSAADDYAQRAVFDQHEGPVYAASFAPDGARVASGGYDNAVCLWSPDQVQATDIVRRIEGLADARPDYTRLTGHQGAVRGVAFSADGQRLLSASYDNTLRLWDVPAAELIKTLRGHGAGVKACAFSPDGQWAVSGGQDQRVRLWDIAGYEESRILRGRVLDDHADAVLSARFSSDGSRIITASRDRSSKLWDAASGALLVTFAEGHEFLASSAEFFANGERMATGAGDDSVRVWDVAAGAELYALRPTGRAAALAVSRDGAWIATGGPDNQARIWPAHDGAEPVILTGHQQEVTAAAFAPDGRTAATGDDRGVIRVWTLVDGGWAPAHVLTGHSRTITGLAFAGDRLVSASGDDTCGQWDLATGQEHRDSVLKHPDWVSSLDVSADGRLAITTCDDGAVRVWDLATAAVIASHARAASDGAANPYTHVDFSPDAETALLTVAAENQVESWPWRADQPPRAILGERQRGGQLWAAKFAGAADRVLTIGGNDAQLWDATTGQAVIRFSPHGAVSSAALSPSGRVAATGSWDNSVKLWDTASGNATRKLEGAHTGYVNSVMFSPLDDNELLTASDDGLALLWRLDQPDSQPLAFRGHRGRVLQAVYSADAERVLTAGADRTARLWDRTGRELRVFTGHEWAVLSCSISPDGTRIATGGEDNTAIVWDAATGAEVARLDGHTASVTSVAFSSDGARVLTGSQDRAAKLWDAATGKEVLTLDGHTREVTSVAFSPDGQNALTASRDGAAMLWLAEPWLAEPPNAGEPRNAGEPVARLAP